MCTCVQDAEAKNLYVKRSDGTSAYEGWCWPGSSSWIDFVSPENRRWWAEQFAPDKYQVCVCVGVGEMEWREREKGSERERERLHYNVLSRDKFYFSLGIYK